MCGTYLYETREVQYFFPTDFGDHGVFWGHVGHSLRFVVSQNMLIFSFQGRIPENGVRRYGFVRRKSEFPTESTESTFERNFYGHQPQITRFLSHAI